MVKISPADCWLQHSLPGQRYQEEIWSYRQGNFVIAWNEVVPDSSGQIFSRIMAQRFLATGYPSGPLLSSPSQTLHPISARFWIPWKAVMPSPYPRLLVRGPWMIEARDWGESARFNHRHGGQCGHSRLWQKRAGRAWSDYTAGVKNDSPSCGFTGTPGVRVH